MGDVIALDSARRKLNRDAGTQRTAAPASASDVVGHIHFTAYADGNNRISVTGAYADRLQYAAITLIKGLNAVSDQIAASTTSGHTMVHSLDEVLPSAHQPLPSRLARSRTTDTPE